MISKLFGSARSGFAGVAFLAGVTFVGMATVPIVNADHLPADLQLVKTYTGKAFSIPIDSSEEATFDLVVTNVGHTATTQPFTVTDESGLDIKSITQAGATCTISANPKVASCVSSSTLAAGASAAPIRVVVRNNLCGTSQTVLNKAFVRPGAGEPAEVIPLGTTNGGYETGNHLVGSNNDSQATSATLAAVPCGPVTPVELDLKVRKTTSTPVVVIGGTVRFTVTVTNLSLTATTKPITVVDRFPVGITPTVTSGLGWTCVIAGQVVTCTRPSLASSLDDLILEGTVDATVSSGASLKNLVKVVPGVGEVVESNPLGLANGGFETGDNMAGSNNDASVSILVATPIELKTTKLLTSATYTTTGQTVTFTVNAENVGTGSTTQPVTVTDRFPVGVTPTAASGTGWVCTIAGQVVTCVHAAPISAASPAGLITLTGTVPGPVTSYSNLLNYAKVVPGAGDVEGNPVGTSNDGYETGYNGAGSNNDSSAAVELLPPIDLKVTKFLASTSVALPGSSVTFTAKAENLGQLATTQPVTVVDKFPVGITPTAASGTGWVCTIAGQIVTCVYAAPIAAAGSAGLITYTGTVDASATTGPVTNLVKVVPGAGELTENTPLGTTNGGYETGNNNIWSNNDSSASVTIGGPVEMKVTKLLTSNLTAIAGDTVTFTVNAENIGTGSTTQPVTVTDRFPYGVTPTAASGTGWVCTIAGQVVTCVHAAPISAASPAGLITYTATVPINGFVGSRRNHAKVTTGAGETVEGNPVGTDDTGYETGDNTIGSNNDSSAAVLVYGPVELKMTKLRTSPSAATVNDTVSFTLNAENIGTGTTTMPVTVTDKFPVGITPTVATGTGWVCTIAAQIVTCTHAAPITAASPAALITVSGTVNTTTPGTLKNFSYVETMGINEGITLNFGAPYETGDNTIGSNNDSSADVTITVPPPLIDLRVTKTLTTTGSLTRGSNASFDVVVTNSGLAPTTQAFTVTDQFPVGFTPVSGTGAGFTCATPVGQEIVCTQTPFVAVAPGAVAGTITFVGTVAASTVSGTFKNLTKVVPGAGETIESNLLGTANNGYETGDPTVGSNNDASADVIVVVPASLAGNVYVAGTTTPIAGVTITATDTTTGTVYTATTNISGAYSFPTLPAGTYTVVETQPTGFLDGPDIAGTGATNPGVMTNDTFTGVVLASGQNAVMFDFTEQLIVPASLAGIVKVTGTNAPIAGVLIRLTGTDYAGNTINVFTTTGADGKYLFASVPPGTYTVTETHPSGYTDFTDSVGSKGGTLGNDIISGVVLVSGDAAINYDFIEAVPVVAPPVPASLAGSVKVVGTNAPIAGVLITLTGVDAAGNSITLTTTTGTDGKYLFANVPAGTYTVTETHPAGYTDATDTAGSKGGTAGNDVITGVTLVGGDAAINYDFTETVPVIAPPVPASLAGMVKVTGTNAPIAGVLITLTGVDAAGNSITMTTLTGTDGKYVFASVPAGTYTVTETHPAGYTDTTDSVGSKGGTLGNDVISNIVLVGGDVAVNYDFIEAVPVIAPPVPASLAGMVKVTGTNAPIAGVLITLTGVDAAGNNITMFATTAADGKYLFANVPAGTYTVTETHPAGYTDTTDSVGSKGGTLGNDVITNIVLVGGDAAINYDFIEAVPVVAPPVPASLAGSVKVVGTNAPIAGVLITLTGVDAAGNSITLTTLTGTDGKYVFASVPAGTYTVTETHPAGYTDATDTAGSKGGTAGNDVITGVTLVAGDAAINYDFTETAPVIAPPVPASLAGKVTVVGTNAPIAGVLITLTGVDAAGNNITMTTLTGTDGKYSFASVPAGTYTVTETHPAGYTDTTDSVGSKGGTLGNDVITNIVLVGGDVAINYDFIEAVTVIAPPIPASLAGSVKVVGTNAPIAGVLITLTGTDAAGNNITLTTLTGPDGKYSFASVPAGTYTVTETHPAGYTDATDTAGSKGGTAGNDVITGVVLVGGDAAINYDFTETAPVIAPPVPASLAGKVTVVGTNAPIAGVLITLTGVDAAGNSITLTTLTGTDGKYVFTNVPAGTYTVTETHPAGYTDATDTAGSKGGTAGNDVISNIVLVGGDAATDYDFTETAPVIAPPVPASLAGSVKVAVTNAPIAGVLITLTGTDAAGNSITLTTLTGTDGKYVFASVPAGTYTVTETHPAGYTDATDSVGSEGGTLGNDVISNIVLVGGDAAINYDFTETAPVIAPPVPASLAGKVTVVGTNAPIAGVLITLTGTDAAGNSITLTTLTGTDGKYVFASVPAGTYTVTETHPAGYTDDVDSVGSEGGTLGNDVISNIVLVAGDAATDYDFTEAIPTPITTTTTTTLPEVTTTTPATTPGTVPATTPATTPGTVPATTPATTPGTVPATTPGTVPATTPGTVPATTPGTVPATTPGTVPATTPGTVPATTPGTTLPLVVLPPMEAPLVLEEPAKPLAYTGSEVGTLGLVGASSLMAGFVLLAARRRKSDSIKG